MAGKVMCPFTEAGQGGLTQGHVLGKRRPRAGGRKMCKYRRIKKERKEGRQKKGQGRKRRKEKKEGREGRRCEERKGGKKGIQQGGQDSRDLLHQATN